MDNDLANQSSIVCVQNVSHRYSGVRALDGVSLSIEPRSFTAILGPNGAGKSTLAHVLAGFLKPSTGDLICDGVHRKFNASRSLIREGICLVPEGRRLFGELTILENLLVAGYGIGMKRKQILEHIQVVSAMLPPALKEGMSSRIAMSLSGGERQLLALCRALMSDPRLIILDEPSMGLAPIMVKKVYEILLEMQRNGAAIVVIEQIATHAIQHADKLYLLSRGRVVYSGPASCVAASEAIQSSYVGQS